MAADLIGLGVIYNQEHVNGPIAITLILVYITLFEFSLGPIIWIYMSETMTDKGTSLGTLVNLLLTLTMALITPIMIDLIKGYYFMSFGGFSAIVITFLFSLVLVWSILLVRYKRN